MRGRSLFAKVKPLISACSAVCSIVPKPIFKVTWWLVKPLPGFVGSGVRYIYLKRLAKSIGDNVMFNTGVDVKNWGGLSIGDNVTVQQNCYIDSEGGVTIGNEVSIAHQTSILSFEHTFDDPNTPIKSNPRVTAPVVIADDVWIGCGVRILSGADIGRRTVVAAGAVVRRGAIGGAIYGGVPARKLADFKKTPFSESPAENLHNPSASEGSADMRASRAD